jgi:hypothetical protein
VAVSATASARCYARVIHADDGIEILEDELLLDAQDAPSELL